MKTYKAVLADDPRRIIILPHEMTATGASYVAGNLPPNYPVPALHVDSIADLGERWASWVDTDAQYGIRW